MSKEKAPAQKRRAPKIPKPTKSEETKTLEVVIDTMELLISRNWRVDQFESVSSALGMLSGMRNQLKKKLKNV